jgi:transglutaminase-like putative cysteine protease
MISVSFTLEEHVIDAMNASRKTHAARRHRQTHKWLVVVSVLILIAMLVTVAYFWYPASSSKPANSELNNMPAGFKTLAADYLEVMKNLNSSQTKTKMASLLDPKYNQTDLFTWEQGKLTFVQDPAGWFEDPTQILDSGKGICVQWSIVYVSACLALGYQSRLVVAVDTTSWSFIHTWAEDYYNGSWVHVDPSDKVWNNPSRYQSWDWGKNIGSTVRIYAFEDGTFQDVTSTYSAH